MGAFAPAKPDWQLVPDLEQPLAEVIARASPRIGAYRMLERVGEGAMGEVFRAVNVHDGSQAALILVHRDASANPDTRRRLEREGELVSRLAHPNIVRLLERGEHDGRLYLAMEFLAGKALQARLSEPQPPPLDEAIGILRDIAAALAALHARGVIHRDRRGVGRAWRQDPDPRQRAWVGSKLLRTLLGEVRDERKNQAPVVRALWRVHRAIADQPARSAAMRSSSGGWVMNRRFRPAPTPPLMPKA